MPWESLEEYDDSSTAATRKNKTYVQATKFFLKENQPTKRHCWQDANKITKVRNEQMFSSPPKKLRS